MSTYKVTYFNYKAAAEPIRFILAHAGIEFEDIRIKEEDWPELKQTTPMAQLPIIEIDGKVFHQSTAIARYLAKKFNLAGKDDMENFYIDIAFEAISDVRLELYEIQYEENDERKAEKLSQLAKGKIPFFIEKLDSVVKENNGYFALGRLTWVDLYFVASLDYFNFMAKQDLLVNAPNLKALTETVLELENIKKWVAIRPVTEA